MNFNDINGVWPQIKDYIDSKFGGINKYKHMIYACAKFSVYDVEYRDQTYKTVQIHISNTGNSGYNEYTCDTKYDLSQVGFFIYNNTVSFGATDFQYIYPMYNYEGMSDCFGRQYLIAFDTRYDHAPWYLNNTGSGSSSRVFYTLKEGWYINYMGQIYDWKGNIIE